MKVAAILLAAGRSRRMGRPKLLADLAGAPLIRHAAQAALASRASLVLLVTGPDGEAIRRAAGNHPKLQAIETPDPDRGLSASLATGIAALPPTIEAALLCLADMPKVGPAILDRLIEAAEFGAAIAMPTHAGQRGHPVLFTRRFFPALQELTGDQGAKPLLARHATELREVEVADPAILADVDTEAALAALRAGVLN